MIWHQCLASAFDAVPLQDSDSASAVPFRLAAIMDDIEDSSIAPVDTTTSLTPSLPDTQPSDSITSVMPVSVSVKFTFT